MDVSGLHDLNIPTVDAAGKITPRTKAIMVVHYAGFAEDIGAIEHGLAIIEDRAHAPRAVYTLPPGNQKVGARGSIACFSFFSNKNLTTGKGGYWSQTILPGRSACAWPVPTE